MGNRAGRQVLIAAVAIRDRSGSESAGVTEFSRILIADDHPLVRSGLAALLTSALPGCSCAEAGSLAEAVAILTQDPAFDLITLDLDLPDAKRLDALAELRRRYPEIPVAVLSGNRDPSLARAALAAGASGFISKMQKPDALLSAISAICDSGLYDNADLAPADPGEARAFANKATLTAQQAIVFGLVADGRLNKQIAHELNISLTTVKAHVSAILVKMEVVNRTQAVILAKTYGLFS